MNKKNDSQNQHHVDHIHKWYSIAHEKLGKEAEQIKPEKNFKNHLVKPCSMIGVIGATGSGKTTAVIEMLSRKPDSFYEIIIFSGSSTQEPLYELHF